MALFNLLRRSEEPTIARPPVFILGAWLDQYANRNNRERGIALRNELALAKVSSDQFLVLNLICRDDKDALFVLASKEPSEPLSARDLERIAYSEDGHRLMVLYTEKIRNLARRGK